MIQAWIIGYHEVPVGIGINDAAGVYAFGNFVVKEDDYPPVILTREQFHEEFEWMSSAQDMEEAEAFRRAEQVHTIAIG